MYLEKEFVDKILIPYKKEKGYVKGVNTKSLPIHGLARDANIQIGPWRGKVDINTASLDDRKFYLGMDFFDRAKAFIVSYASTLFIMVDGQVHLIPMRQETKKKRVLPALRFSKIRN